MIGQYTILLFIWPCDDLKVFCENYIRIFKWKPAQFITYCCNWHWDVYRTLQNLHLSYHPLSRYEVSDPNI